MNTFKLTTESHSKFLEYLAGAPQYRTVGVLVKIFGNSVWHDIPTQWYEKSGGKIRLSLAGWNELVSRGGTIRNTRFIPSAIRSGRAVYARGDCHWVKPSYLESKAGVK